MKLAMVRVDAALAREQLDAVMVLQIHDELIFEAGAATIERAAALIKREMEAALELSVPLEVTLKSGPTWYDVEAFSQEIGDGEPPEEGEG
jgi:DNA polymerase-1